MTPRERFVNTLTFQPSDRIPFMPGGGRESTLAAWRRQGLPEDVEPMAYAMEQLGIAPQAATPLHDVGVDFRMIPQFEEKIIEHANGHYIVQDWKGNICEISDRYDPSYLRHAKDFVTRRWISCPVQRRDDWEQIKQRYDAEAPERFGEDFQDRCEKLKKGRGLVGLFFHGPFWQMREWCGFERLCIMTIEQPDLVEEMAAFWTDFVAKLLARLLRHIVPDVVIFNEDMAYKAKAMISPAMTRRFCQPSYLRWGRQLAEAGCPLIGIDSDGFIGELIPIWIESGLNLANPVEVAAHNDINAFRRSFGRKMAYWGGVDKRMIAKGGQALRAELRRLEPVIRDGGFIPACDHGIPPDVSWVKFLEFCDLLARITGWL